MWFLIAVGVLAALALWVLSRALGVAPETIVKVLAQRVWAAVKRWWTRPSL